MVGMVGGSKVGVGWGGGCRFYQVDWTSKLHVLTKHSILASLETEPQVPAVPS